ncbi:hypothetical protein SMGD1_2804 [Sulfurimonas gotlandica GD1]|uniref:Uncharacterized protein n=1 Tax=Sulfurimonas gotlandica (strain DSM 19862 / JCM 16533 / GD1) TaxID=929558 RepID=B6BJS6_SULGG|nr:hypothetical protein [Sulfurimonas gotlandica]EDZ62541.1 hypothetical protein CBGD1_2108 [Sulfurimonas gotlandica GD1]EHP31326.1 hypothetical protein SMGD1_2804 [Sulfurimonas gotlandica GD1]
MKAFLITLLLVSFLQADEMKRIESIVQDITKLRAQYEECKNNLNAKETLKAEVAKPENNVLERSEYQKELKTQRQKNIILIAEVDYLTESSANNEKMIKKYEKLLKTKENEILALKKKLNSNKKTAPKKTKPAEICVKDIDDNPFPKLMPKENAPIIEEIEITKANTFRLNDDSQIYDSPNGKKIDSWTMNTSFTSNRKTKNWVKITGYFTDKKWKKAQQEMWVKHSQVSKK